MLNWILTRWDLTSPVLSQTSNCDKVQGFFKPFFLLVVNASSFQLLQHKDPIKIESDAKSFLQVDYNVARTLVSNSISKQEEVK